MITRSPFFKVNSLIGIRTLAPVCAGIDGVVARRQTSNMNAGKTFNLDIFFLQIRDLRSRLIGLAQPPGDQAAGLGL